MIGDPQQQFTGITGLGDIVHPAGGEAARLVLVVIQGGEEDHRDRAGRRVGLEAFADLKAVQTRHADVEQDQVWPQGGGQLQARGAIGCADQVQALIPEDLGGQVLIIRLVIDDQQGQRNLSGSAIARQGGSRGRRRGRDRSGG